MYSLTRLALMAGVALVAACGGDDDSDVDISGGEPVQLGEGDIRITSRGGEIDLMLVGDKIVAGLSDSVLAKVRAETDTSALEAENDLGASIEKFVKSTVQKTLAKRIEYPLADVEDASYEDGRIVFEYRDGAKFQMLESSKSDDIPVLASFSEEDSKRFVAAVKSRLDRGGSEPSQASAEAKS